MNNSTFFDFKSRMTKPASTNSFLWFLKHCNSYLTIDSAHLSLQYECKINRLLTIESLHFSALRTLMWSDRLFLQFTITLAGCSAQAYSLIISIIPQFNHCSFNLIPKKMTLFSRSAVSFLKLKVRKRRFSRNYQNTLKQRSLKGKKQNWRMGTCNRP